MKNKILNKFLLPYYISAAGFVFLSGAAANLAPKVSKMHKDIYGNEYYMHSDINYFLCVAVILASLTAAGYCGGVLPRKANNKANELTKRYLQIVFFKHPELKKYGYILNDPKALRKMATVICNGLTKNEQKRMVRIARIAFDALGNTSKTEYEADAYVKGAETDILSIVKEHAEKDPKYMENILMAMADYNKTYVMPMNQKSR